MTFDINRFKCVDCDVDRNEYAYTLTKAAWAKTGLGPHGGMLCIGCLHKRLGRKLEPADVDWTAPINDIDDPDRHVRSQFRRSPRLQRLLVRLHKNRSAP